MTTGVPSWVLRLCAEIIAAKNAELARHAVWDAFNKIAALPPHEHVAASQMIRDAMRGRGN
jgi:hypothetical protein